MMCLLGTLAPNQPLKTGCGSAIECLEPPSERWGRDSVVERVQTERERESGREGEKKGGKGRESWLRGS